MEILELLEHFINNVGFPIAAFVLMYLQNTKLTKALGDLKETMVALDKDISEAVENLDKGGKQ